MSIYPPISVYLSISIYLPINFDPSTSAITGSEPDQSYGGGQQEKFEQRQGKWGQPQV